MKPVISSLVMCVLMAGAAATSVAVAPMQKMADSRPHFDLESGIPAAFGSWKIDPNVVPLEVDPDTQARLNKIYNQTLSRTYIDDRGQRVMLSIAYGGDQSDNMGVHKPEVCYVAQGFEVRSNKEGELSTDFARLPVRNLLAVAGGRSEPITYWITIGDAIAKPGIDQRMQQLRIGLTGTVADGMLVRVSTIDTDTARAYQIQQDFVRAMLAGMSPQGRARLIGTPQG